MSTTIDATALFFSLSPQVFYQLAFTIMSRTAEEQDNKMTPTEISHYRIMGELGHGGMASVYKAIDTTTGNPVALKILLPHLATDEKVHRRFLREGNTGLRLNHPGIAKVFKVGEEHDRPFIAMERMKEESVYKSRRFISARLSSCNQQ